MKPSDYHSVKSFFGKTRIVLVLLGIIPYLLVVYLFVYEKMALSDMVVLFSAIALFSILTGFYLMRTFADQLVLLAREMSKLEEIDDGGLMQIKTDQELQDISEHFTTVVKRLKEANRSLKEQSTQLLVYAKDLSLSYEKIKKEEVLRQRLSRYLEDNLVEKLINSEDSVLIDKQRKEVTVLFADIRSFTSLAEKMPAEDVVAMLNQFFEIMVDIVFHHNGVLDKLVGDQVMAVFGLIEAKTQAPLDAIHAALAMQTATKELMARRSEKKQETFEIGIGINTGNAIIGNVGSKNRMDHTVIGDCVNVAARFEEMAKGGEIIIGEETYQRTRGHVEVVKKGKTRLKHKTEPVCTYLVMGQARRE